MSYYGFFARDVSDMGYQTGGEIMASLLPVATHMQNKLLKVRFYLCYIPINRVNKNRWK
jgi:hypothetical protein